jgi:hypothetical protein
MNQHIKIIISIVRSVAICLMLLCAAAMTTHAVTITVINTNDSGAGSLRQALADANDGDTINFSITAPATITLTSGELLVNKSLTVSGPGADQLSVNGNAASRVFHISSGKSVTLSGVTITNGSSSYGSGGGILNDHATLTVSSCTLSGNSAGSGGGISNDGVVGGSATLTINNSTLSGNSAGYGGGLFNDSRAGGSATLTINNSTLSGNNADIGGGIFNDGFEGSSATLTINDSTLRGNSASSSGGIFNNGAGGSATLTINNSTLSGNSASSSGGIFNDGEDGSATLTINNSTLSGNSASTYGGGIYNYGYYGSATLQIRNTILKTGASGENIVNFSGTVTSDGYNLSSDNGSGFLTATGDQVNTDPLLGPLQDNGGPTFTHELLSGSPAIDAGDPSFTPPDYDQRGPGFPRVVNGRVDIGAFEVQASASVCPQPQAYWKVNPDVWPVNELTLGSQTYSKTELLTLLNTRIRSGRNGDASLILADQLIAAKLNVANGSDPAPVSDTITHADGLLSGYTGKLPYRVRSSTAAGQAMVNDANALGSYNNGELTPNCTP